MLISNVVYLNFDANVFCNYKVVNDRLLLSAVCSYSRSIMDNVSSGVKFYHMHDNYVSFFADTNGKWKLDVYVGSDRTINEFRSSFVSRSLFFDQFACRKRYVDKSFTFYKAMKTSQSHYGKAYKAILKKFKGAFIKKRVEGELQGRLDPKDNVEKVVKRYEIEHENKVEEECLRTPDFAMDLMM